ncbi:MAG TPA: HAMP domain-containing sensor histidine kinase, partial [Polyangia bacterium]|nr:HAMP domain-containing sensor histidine kinase [Polyangia bacterium]
FACLPLVTPHGCLGAMALTFDGERELDEAERRFLLLLGRTAWRTLERLGRLEGERASRARAELLYKLAAAVIGADRVEDVFDAALDAIAAALGTHRCAILVQDADDVMRFRAWRGLSDEYRRTVEGDPPWKREVRDAQPVLVSDVERDVSLVAYQSLFRSERIGALAVVPLVSGDRLLGKLMVTYDQPRALIPAEVELARAIANHLAAAVDRFRFMADLQGTVRFNEMFTGILGHDLRNPLAAIITSARLAMSRDSSDRLRKPLARILNSGDRMTRMIDQLLDFTRVRLGSGIPVAPVDVDLAALIRQVMDELEGANPGCPLRLACAGDSRGQWDPDRLSQVFSNLVANAVHHGVAEHGVDVTLDGGAGDVVRVEIKNRGLIPPRRMQTLFEPMAGASRTSASRGLGLGLFITRELVRAHGGSIQVRSERGTDGAADDSGFTAFTIVLPRRPTLAAG